MKKKRTKKSPFKKIMTQAQVLKMAKTKKAQRWAGFSL